MLGMPMLEMPIWSRTAAIARHASVTGLNSAQPIGAESEATGRGFIYQPAARIERSEIRGKHIRLECLPGFAEPVIGPAKGRTRWLNPGYDELKYSGGASPQRVI
jgi:hypothetical protein